MLFAISSGAPASSAFTVTGCVHVLAMNTAQHDVSLSGSVSGGIATNEQPTDPCDAATLSHAGTQCPAAQPRSPEHVASTASVQSSTTAWRSREHRRPPHVGAVVSAPPSPIPTNE